MSISDILLNFLIFLVDEYLDKAQDTANYYKDNPQEHLKELLRRKFNGENI